MLLGAYSSDHPHLSIDAVHFRNPYAPPPENEHVLGVMAREYVYRSPSTVGASDLNPAAFGDVP